MQFGGTGPRDLTPWRRSPLRFRGSRSRPWPCRTTPAARSSTRRSMYAALRRREAWLGGRVPSREVPHAPFALFSLELRASRCFRRASIHRALLSAARWRARRPGSSRCWNRDWPGSFPRCGGDRAVGYARRRRAPSSADQHVSRGPLYASSELRSRCGPLSRSKPAYWPGTASRTSLLLRTNSGLTWTCSVSEAASIFLRIPCPSFPR